MGKVYLANASPAWATYTVNGGPKLTGRPAAAGPNPPPYTPYFAFVPLGRHPDAGTLGYGANDVVVLFQDTTPADVPHLFQVDVPPTVSVDDSLILYAFRGALWLMTARGMPLPPNPQLIPGIPAGTPAG